LFGIVSLCSQPASGRLGTRASSGYGSAGGEGDPTVPGSGWLLAGPSILTPNGVTVNEEIICPGGTESNPNSTAIVCSGDYIFLFQIPSGPNDLVLSFSGLNGFAYNTGQFASFGVLTCDNSGGSGQNMLCTEQADAMGADDMGSTAVGGNLIITVPSIPTGGTLTFFVDESPSVLAPLNVALAPPALSVGGMIVSPPALAFGSQEAGSSTPAQTLTVINYMDFSTGLSLSAPTVPQGFTASNNCTGPLASGNSCGLSVAFSPTAPPGSPGTMTASTLMVSDNSPAEGELVALSGYASTLGVTIAQSALVFGSQTIGLASAPQQVKITNSLQAPLTISSITPSLDSVTGLPDFTYTDDDCLSAPVPTNEACSGTVAFNPTLGGWLTAVLTISDNSPEGIHVVVLSGTANQPNTATSSSAALDFGNQPVGIASTPQSVTVTNTGTGTLNIVSVQPTADFMVTNPGSCMSSSIAPQGTCQVSIAFQPTVAGPRTGTLTIADDAVDGTLVITLSGTGTVPSAGVQPSSLGFGNEAVGTSSGAQTVSVSNSGAAPLVVSSVSVSGTDSGDFAATDNSCTSPVSPGGSCTVSVTFAPTSALGRTATLTITDNDQGVAGSTQTVTLTGTGTAPEAALAPGTVSFGGVNVNTASPVSSVTLTNSGNAALTISSITISGENQNDFTRQSTSTCSASSQVAAGGKCTIDVTFKPSAAGSRTSTLTVTDNSNNAASGTQTVQLAGTGQDFSVSVGNGGSASVSPGSAATYTLTLTPQDGYNDMVQVTCAEPAALTESSCSVSPSSTSLSGTNPVNVTISVTTTAPSMVPLARRTRPPWRVDGNPWSTVALLLSVTGLIGLVISLNRRGCVPRLLATLVAVACLSCGGGGGGGGGGGNLGTPQGNYTITITVSGGNVTQTTTVTLMVD